MKTKLTFFLVVLFVVVAAIPSGHAARDTSETRLAQLVEANIIAVHAFQVLLAKSSGKGGTCFSSGNLPDQALNALSEHQAKLLKAVYVYFDNDQAGYAAQNALDLREMVLGSAGKRISDAA